MVSQCVGFAAFALGKKEEEEEERGKGRRLNVVAF